MLSVLKIKNLALVDDLVWEVGPGLVGVTGETGAGKSMIVGALKLILGERASRDLVRNGADQCSVEAVFELGANLEGINTLLEEAGLEPCEDQTLVVKRVFGGSSSRQFINCSPSTLAVLKRLGELLVDLHGPHEHQSLLSQERQLTMLDAYASCEKEREAYRSAWAHWQECVGEFEEVRQAEQASGQEVELLRFQVEEIESAAIELDEVAELEKRYELTRNSSRLVSAANEAARALSESVVGGLEEVQRQLRELEKLDPDAVEMTAGFDSAQVELEELERGLRGYVERLEGDPTEVAALEARIDLFEALKRKYGSTLEEVVAYGENAAIRLRRIDGRGEELERLQIAVQEAREQVNGCGATLSKKRRKAAPRLATEIARHLEDLGFAQSRFEIELERQEEPAASGLERCEFVFAPNPGEPPRALRIVASSGEMSRVMLAVKSALAQEDQIPLMVFDEIDANVGGEIAHSVGKKMAALGQQHQVLAITHMPQVAARAHQHYVVRKEMTKSSTRSVLQAVSGETRVNELTRMLGGQSESAKALALSLLEGAGH